MTEPTEIPPTEPDVPTLDDVRAALARDIAGLDTELAEIALLVQQATTEAGRHEARRTAAADRLLALREGPPADAVETGTQLASLTRRAAVMDAQVEVLEGKAKILRRYRDGLVALDGSLASLPDAPGGPAAVSASTAPADGSGTLPIAVARIVHSAQEDLRREISRAMHDGPAQSLTNIVLQAQIVERLVTGDPDRARDEVRQLVAMVQHTLEATKSFIFDVRPMVLDDLGLVPTLRRAARDRGRRAHVPVEFESFGVDVRLPMELETGLFRLIDETLAGFLANGPDRVDIRLEWNGRLEAAITASRMAAPASADAASTAAPDSASRGRGKRGRGEKAQKRSEPIPAALAAMIEERDAAAASARAEAARKAAWIPLAPGTWREIADRAAMLGIAAERNEDGTRVTIEADIAVAASPG